MVSSFLHLSEKVHYHLSNDGLGLGQFDVRQALACRGATTN